MYKMKGELQMINGHLKNNCGITIVALVITVIILLILAAITINGLVGENGIITRAREGRLSTELSNYKEQL